MRLAIIKNNIVENVIAITEQNRQSSIDFNTALGYTCIVTDSASPGDTYSNNKFIRPVVPEVIQPYEWFIDIGPFFDRFGDTKLYILTSADPGIKAILADIQIRKWIDLKRTDVATSLAYIGSIIPALTQSKQNMIMNVIPSDEENLALRKLYFS